MTNATANTKVRGIPTVGNPLLMVVQGKIYDVGHPQSVMRLHVRLGVGLLCASDSESPELLLAADE